MAARKQLWHPDEVRKKIKVSLLINRLHEHAISNSSMDNSQIQAAQILLRKVLPDLAATTVQGDPDKPIKHKISIEFVRPE